MGQTRWVEPSLSNDNVTWLMDTFGNGVAIHHQPGTPLGVCWSHAPPLYMGNTLPGASSMADLIKTAVDMANEMALLRDENLQTRLSSAIKKVGINVGGPEK